MANAGRKGVIHGRVTERARNTHRTEAAIIIKESSDPHNSIQLKQSQGYSRVIQINFALFQLSLQGFGQSFDIHLQADCQGCCWAHSGSYPAELFTLDRLM